MSIFNKLQSVVKFIDMPYDVTTINYVTDQINFDAIETNRSTVSIMANIQQITAREIKLDRNQANIFDRILIITNDNFLIGDPQDVDAITDEGISIISYQQRLYRLMEKAHIQTVIYRYEANILRSDKFGITPST